jgi:hypothetical protein
VTPQAYAARTTVRQLAPASTSIAPAAIERTLRSEVMSMTMPSRT